jgi:hypothetical protein
MERGSPGTGPEAGAGAAGDAAAFEELRERVRGIRNVITHFDDRLAMGYAAVVEVTAEGFTARQRGITLALAFVEWDHWLGQLERRANRVLEEPRGEEPRGAPPTR